MARLFNNLKELYKYRVLIQNLVSRELKARYRGTVLGFLWSFFNPLLLMIVYTVVFGFILSPRDPAFDRKPWSMPSSSSAASCPGSGSPPPPSSRPTS